MRKQANPRGESRRDFLKESVALAALAFGAGNGRAASAASGTPMNDQRAARMLTVMAATLYPHASLPPALYSAVSAAVLSKAHSDPAVHQMLNSGLLELDASSGGDWLALPPAAQLGSLRLRQNGAFFQFVRGMTALNLYSNPEVWKRFGYGGDAWSFGGYAGKNLDDIAWLPEPSGAP
jgi:hypothetical protein